MALTDNLIAYWKLDESSGTTLADATGTSHDGTINGTIGFASGLINNCITMTSSQANNFAAIANSGDFNATTDITISLWQKTAVVGGHYLSYMDNNTQEEILYGVGRGSSLSGYYMNGTSGKPSIYCKNKGNSTYSASGSVDDNAWHHVVLLLNSTYIQIYVDGTRTLNQAVNGTWSAGDRTLRIGNRYVSSPQYYGCWGGLMDEIGRWNRELSSTEIGTLYNSGDGLAYPFTPSSAIKTVNGLAKASVKTVNGLAIASVKTINGLA